MRIVALHHPKSDHAGKVEDYAREYHARHPDRKLELVSLEQIQGSEMAKLYDIFQYPAILIIAAEGRLQKFWQDDQLPLMDELMAFSTAQN
jgi:hypothetical protein